MERYRVRAMHKNYGDKGPDLLRTDGNAQRHFAMVAGTMTDGWWLRSNPPGDKHPFTEWQGPYRRHEMLQEVVNWQRRAGHQSKLQVGRHKDGKPDPKAEMMIENVRVVNMPNVNEGAELVADLARAQFGTNGVYILGFMCREYNSIPGSGWSDHAWGDAVDLVPQGIANDRLTDWLARMGQEGQLGSCAQLIGSRDGRVGTFYAPQYQWNAGGPSSHLTHVHASYRQHYGANPGCS